MSLVQTTQLLRETIARVDNLEKILTNQAVINEKQAVINEKTIDQIGKLIDFLKSVP